jgi:hypothetical protein
MTKHVRVLPAILTIVCLLTLNLSARAGDDISTTAVRRANNFFKTEKRGKDILGALHFGARYDGHTLKEYTRVTDSDGRTVPGHFCLVYDFQWAGDGKTQIGFFCDARGNFYSSKVIKTNAFLSQPYAVAKLSIKLLGETLLAAFKDDLKEDDRKAIRKMIDDADPRGLMEVSLKFQQALGR